MKKKAYVIIACPRRDQSRTLFLGSAFLAMIKDKYDLVVTDVEKLDIKPKTKDDLDNPHCSEEVMNCIKNIHDSDKIIIIAPFWDMMFPSILKVFIENTIIPGYTMNKEDSLKKGPSKAEELLLITTRGWNIKDESELDGASYYLRALSFLWGVDRYKVISAYGLDEEKEQVEYKLEKAINELKAYAKEF